MKSRLRFTTTGDTATGNSTLLKRLVSDAGSVLEAGDSSIKSNLIFASEKRKFLITDIPGREQGSHEVVDAASNAGVALLLIDALKGIQIQTKKHGFLLSLLQVPHLIVAVNKMDLVEYSQEVFERIVAEFREYLKKLDIHDIAFIPVSALEGDNIVHKSSDTPWYQGETLLQLLENLDVIADRNLVDFRFPVESIVETNDDLKRISGTIASGTIREGDKIAVLPSTKQTVVEEIFTNQQKFKEASIGKEIVLRLNDDVGVSPGDMLVRPQNLPMVSSFIDADICWFGEKPTDLSGHYILEHTTKKVKAYISKIHYTIDVNSLHRNLEADNFELNDVGRVEIKTVENLFFDSYRKNRGTGSFFLIDSLSNKRVAKGMIRGKATSLETLIAPEKTSKSTNVVWQKGEIPLEGYIERNRHQPAVLWFTGLSGSGKSTVAQALVQQLFAMDCQVMLLDGDNVRHGLCGDLGFSIDDRSENIRRVSEVAKLFYKTGHIVICTFISPLIKDRALARNLIEDGFLEAFIKCDIDVCIQRDPKGLYKKAIAGLIPDFTGISSPYEAPEKAELILETDTTPVEQSVKTLMDALKVRGILEKK
ncbi:MAG: adenylyl-sulfate kinase [Proteobacteria bacterium]|nr:adenylyl-sulfate kinase [Pseudomonadota bacterium]